MLEIILILAVLALDQASKFACAAWLPTLTSQSFELIPGVFSLSYVENRGAAFGLMQNAQWLFIPLTIVCCGLLGYAMHKYRAKLHTLIRISLALIFAGAIGNFIDRTAFGYVRDMLYFSLIDFPVFNIADSAICIGGGLLLIDVIFTKKGRALLSELDKGTQKQAEQTETAAPEPQESGEETDDTNESAN